MASDATIAERSEPSARDRTVKFFAMYVLRIASLKVVCQIRGRSRSMRLRKSARNVALTSCQAVGFISRTTGVWS